MKSGVYNHDGIGPVHIKAYPSSRAIRARWRGNDLVVTVPTACPASTVAKFLDANRERILSMRPAQAYTIGQIIDAPRADFTITTGTTAPNSDVRLGVVADAPQRGKQHNYNIILNQRLVEKGIEKPAVQTFINRQIIVAATHAVNTLIVPRGQAIARRLRVAPSEWVVREGRTRYGSCSYRGVITLSPRLIFLPDELSDFVICHELAHLTHMNHSADFHRLCNTYCEGREAVLSRRLKAFRFPVF